MKRIDIERLLPEVFRATVTDPSPLAALLDAMSAMHAPSEHVLETLDGYFDPRRAPDPFVPLLARWVDLDRLFVRSAIESDRGANRKSAQAAKGEGEPISTGTGRLRELIASAAELSQWRGTRRGLVSFLEIATGEKGFEIDEHVPDGSGVERAFHIRVVAPAAVESHRTLIDRIIEFEKPGYVTYELQFATSGA